MLKSMPPTIILMHYFLYTDAFAILFQLCNFVIHIDVYERSIKRKYFFEIGSFKNNLYLYVLKVNVLSNVLFLVLHNILCFEILTYFYANIQV